jgi:hypothetical protein
MEDLWHRCAFRLTSQRTFTGIGNSRERHQAKDTKISSVLDKTYRVADVLTSCFLSITIEE